MSYLRKVAFEIYNNSLILVKLISRTRHQNGRKGISPENLFNKSFFNSVSNSAVPIIHLIGGLFTRNRK